MDPYRKPWGLREQHAQLMLLRTGGIADMFVDGASTVIVAPSQFKSGEARSPSR